MRFRKSIAVGWSLGLSERRHGELERDATCLPDAPLDEVGQIVEVLVARGELGRGVADADHRLAGERVVRQATLHPAAMQIVVARRAAVPAGGPKRDLRLQRLVHERHASIGSSGNIGRGMRAQGREPTSDCVGPGVATRTNDVVIARMYWKFDAVFITIIL